MPVDSAVAKPTRVVKVNKKTNTVIVGDSRVFLMYKSGFNSFSTIASRGGRYSGKTGSKITSKKYGNYQKKTARQEKTSSRYAVIVKALKDSLAKHKRSKIVIFATINECHKRHSLMKEFPGKAVRAIAKFAKKANNVKYKKNGKLRKPKVYVVQCPEALAINSGKNYPKDKVQQYNKALKENAKKYNYTFVSLRKPHAEEFAPDGLHFKANKNGYNRYMWNTINKLK